MNTRTVSYFFTPRDEHQLSSAILERLPNVQFIDIWAWAESFDVSQACRASIADCKTNCYIWDPDSVLALPNDSKPTFHVAHYSRCRLTDDNELYLGQTGVNVIPDDEKQEAFCGTVLRSIRKLKSGPLNAYNTMDDSLASSGITRFVAGPDAYTRAKHDLTLMYGGCYYKPDP